MQQRRYLSDKELSESSGSIPAAPPQGERRYLSEEELGESSGNAPAAPQQGERRYLSEEELHGVVDDTSDEQFSLEETHVGLHLPRRSPEPRADSTPAELPPSQEGGVLRRPAVQGAPQLSSMSHGVTAFLQARLPETLNTLPPARCETVIRDLENGAPYAIGSQLFRGAESILYQGTCEGFNFIVKSIRNRCDHWLGDVRTRKDTGKLSDNVSYATKYKHLSNEWKMGQLLRETAPNPTPVQLYSMRRVKRLGLELGWDLLMERINGLDFSDKKLLSVLSLSDKLRACIMMAQAIHQLHQRRIVHLDIKPSNFLLDRDANVRLIDFGISVPTGFQSRTVAGTAGYFSPEQICCRTLGEDTDVFALGITFGVLFGGRTLMQNPEEAKSRQYRHNAMVDMEKNTLPAVTDIPELNGVFKPLAEVIRDCTIFKRSSRIGNCTALISRLVQAAEICKVKI